MATEVPARTSRPRPWLLVALAVVVALFVLSRMWPSSPAAPATPTARGAARKAPEQKIDPEDLNVRLDALKQDQPGPGESERNPFRFQPRAQTTPPGPPRAGNPPPQFVPPPAPTGPPPVPLKFIGIVATDKLGKVAAFTDCRAVFQGREGSIIDGRYRLVRIGVQSVEMEYLDGRGRTTIRMSGQECVGR